MKSYHVTWDDLPTHDKYGLYPDSSIKDLMEHDIICETQPYLFVDEIGITGKFHYHGYFHSKFSKNTVKKKFQQFLGTQVYFTDPTHPKYKKYERDGVLGVEIYLMKGKTNHMKSTDDLKVYPSIQIAKTSYYGDNIETATRLQHIRKIYEKVVEDMKKYKSEVANISKEKKLTEWQLILKDIETHTLDTRSQIKDYLSFVHYSREKYHFSENGFKNLFRKIFKFKNPEHYSRYIRERMDEIIM